MNCCREILPRGFGGGYFVYMLDEDWSDFLVEYRGEKEMKERSSDIRAAKLGRE